MKRMETLGCYTSVGTIDKFSIKRHPINFVKRGEKIWTEKQLNTKNENSSLGRPHSHIIENIIYDPACKTATTGSNGSVKFADWIVAAALLITHDKEAETCFSTFV